MNIIKAHALPMVVGSSINYLMEDQANALTAAFENWYESGRTHAQRRSRGKYWLTYLALRFTGARLGEVQLVDDQRTEVNWQMAKSASQAVKPGDVISVRGRGRIEIKELPGKSRKGRIGVLIERYR